MKSSTYYFDIKTKTLADFEICISVPLRTKRPFSEVLVDNTVTQYYTK